VVGALSCYDLRMDPVLTLGAFGSVCLLCGSLQVPLVESSAIHLGGTFVYSTVTRKVDGASGVPPAISFPGESADTTPHGAAISLSWQTPAPKGQGVGTPAFEVTGGVVEAISHTESNSKDTSGQVAANGSGNGRFESFYGVVRVPLGLCHSLEAGVEVPFNRSRDLTVSGVGNLYFTPGRRDLYSFTTNVALGYRFRGRGWEASAAGLYSTTSTQNGTGYAYSNGSGTLWGGEAQILRQFGKLGASLAAGAQAGHLTFTEGLYPDFVETRYESPLKRRFVRAEVAYPVSTVSLRFSALWLHVEAPYWDAGATLNVETLLHDGGLDFSTRSNEVLLRLTAEIPLRKTVMLQLTALVRQGSETVDFTATSVNPGSASLSLTRSGWAAIGGFRAAVP
jgi:hypothetical protein